MEDNKRYGKQDVHMNPFVRLNFLRVTLPNLWREGRHKVGKMDPSLFYSRDNLRYARNRDISFRF